MTAATRTSTRTRTRTTARPDRRKARGKPARKPAAATRSAGTFRAHPRGFGFVDLDAALPDGTGSAFVPPPLASGLLDGDRVTLAVRADDRGATAAEVSVTARPRTHVAGTVTTDRGTVRLAVDPQLGCKVTVDVGRLELPRRARRAGHVLVVELDGSTATPTATRLAAGPVPADSPSATRLLAVTRAFGPGTLDGALADPATTARHLDGLLAGQSEPTVKVRRRHRGLPVPGAQLQRHDLTGLPTVTVDGPSTRDLDDAVSARRLRGGAVRVHVHIADVAAHVPAGSALDERARTLATSTYLADHVTPMLPPDLSEGLLSLLPGVARDTLTVAFTVAADGHVSDVELAVSRIVSDDRLTYQQVQGHLDGAGRLAAATGTTVDAMAAAADALGRARCDRDTLDLFGQPAHALAVDDGRLTLVDADPYPDANGLIERLMVAANEAVAGWLVAAGTPALYRTHDGVDPDRAGRLHAALAAAGADGDALAAAGFRAADLAEVLSTAGQRQAAAVAQAAAEAMGRAGYQPDPSRHFGLDSLPYTHFTSPIRRYADLVVHRAVRATLAGEPAPATVEQLAQLAAWIDVRAGASARAEALQRTLLWGQWCRAELAAGRAPTVTATVSKLTRAGLLVRVDDWGIAGFVPAEAATGRRGPLALAADELADTSGRFRLGASAPLRLAEVDDTGRVTLALAG